MVAKTTTFGLQAESEAATYLKKQGFKILDRNWRRPWGELDIVARKGDTLHFIEVKASKSLVAGFEPHLRADGFKMRKVLRTAKTWLAANKYSPITEWQMDVISVIMNEGIKEMSIELFEQVS